MSMHPHIKIVLGVAFSFPARKVERTVTKYDENDGTPYQKSVIERVQDVPAWLKKEWQRIHEEDLDPYPTNGMGVFPDPCSQIVWFAGKLIDLIDPNEMSSKFITIEDFSQTEKIEVLQWLLEKGMPAEVASIDDIKIHVGADWI